jgi:pyruvate kinase
MSRTIPQLRRTKIVATLGPATDDPTTLENLLLAGVNVVRINFSHGDPDEHRRRVEMVREISKRHRLFVAVLGDLQGPKIRIARFADKKIVVNEGDSFTLDAGLDKQAGHQTAVGLDYEDLPKDCKPGDVLMLDDGRIQMQVERIEGNKVHTIVTVGGELSNNKGINLQGGGLSAPALTDKDLRDIKTAAALDVDYLAVSFPRSGADIARARQLLLEAGGDAGIVAKIERAETVASAEALDDMISASDAVMVARGDLGVEIGDAGLVGVQKRIIKRARQLNKVVITATQMMESMINSQLPTRAEVFDVANAVLDGTDAVMLSGETAAGKYPVQTVKAMVRVILGAEAQREIQRSRHRMDQEYDHIDEAIALSVMYSANHLKGVKAIIALTESGHTPRVMSRISSGLPIFALSPSVKAQRKMMLYRGVQSVPFDARGMSLDELTEKSVQALKDGGFVAKDDVVILSRGNQLGVLGGTDTMQIVRVAD